MSVDKDYCRDIYQEAQEALEQLQELVEKNLKGDDKLKAVDLCELLDENMETLFDAIIMSN